jgi:flagellar motor switch protein FliG
MSKERDKLLDVIERLSSPSHEADFEKVNGNEIASNILKSYPHEKREKILSLIQSQSPSVFKKIGSNFFKFEDLCDLTDQSTQKLIQVIQHRDLVIAFQGASRNIQEKLIKNMSKRKAEILLQDIAAIPAKNKSEIREAQHNIEIIADQLRTQGQVRSQEYALNIKT